MFLYPRVLNFGCNGFKYMVTPLVSSFHFCKSFQLNGKRQSCKYHGSRDLRSFIDQVGTNPKDMRFWFKVFQYQDLNPKRPFAVVHIANSIFSCTKLLTRLAESIEFLQQNGLSTVLVVGSDDGFDSTQTTENTIRLTELLEQLGAKTRPFLNSAGILNKWNAENQNLDINAKPIIWSLSSNCIPIIASYYLDMNGNPLNISPMDMVNEISVVLQPLKVMYLNTEGGLLKKSDRKVISSVSFPNDLHLLEKFDKNSRSKILKISSLLKKLPFTSSAVITSADTVIRELFTHSGAGTLLKNYERLIVADSLREVDVNKLEKLLECAFDRHLKSYYIPSLQERLCRIYVTESYSAAAIITNEALLKSVPYLCKFAVLPENQGLGAGESLWYEILNDFPVLFWRSQIKNQINSWYFARAEGSWTSNSYRTFWYGINEPKLSHEMISLVNNLESSFI